VNPYVLCIGGVDHCLRVSFLLALRDRGFRVSAAGTGDPAPFTQAGIDFHRFYFDRFVNPLADLSTLKAVSRLIRDLRPDIVQSFDTKPNWMVPLAARRCKGVLAVRTINGLAWVYSSRSRQAMLYRPVWRMLHRLAAGSTAMTVFQNRDDQAFFERRGMVGRGGCQLIAGSGADIRRFEQAAAAGPCARALREKLGLGGSPVVMTVSRMTREKGIPTLLEAAEMVHRVRSDVRFLLVGPRLSEGPAAVSQAEIDRHAPYVMALGPRDDVPSLLMLADVFAFPSEYREGVPRVLLEAALADLPIVTTTMPGCRDVVRDGQTGLLVPPRAPRILAEKILELLRERSAARDMGHRARQWVEQEFNLDLVVGRYAALYRNLVDAAMRSKPPVSSSSWRSQGREGVPQFDDSSVESGMVKVGSSERMAASPGLRSDGERC
jgi:glycosyltransferase involved in cell wall biosynthesis